MAISLLETFWLAKRKKTRGINESKERKSENKKETVRIGEDAPIGVLVGSLTTY